MVGAFELQHDIACAVTFKSFIGNGWTRDIAAQAFELVALIGGAAHVGMQAKAVFADITFGVVDYTSCVGTVFKLSTFCPARGPSAIRL